jgi:REP element-mobilizing transposase RayT
MANPPAISHDTVYHIFNRGINRADIFIEERNYAYFLSLFLKYIAPIADTYAFCLLGNHFHLLVRILTSELLKRRGFSTSPSQCFSNFFNAYAKAINKAYGRTGSLFQRPFGRVQVLSDAQFLQTVRYIHHNPLNHGFVDDFRDWPFSSYEELLSTEETFLAKDTVLGYFGGREEFVRFHEDQTPRVLETLGVYQIDDL